MWITPESLTQNNAAAVLQSWVAALKAAPAGSNQATMTLDLEPLRQFDSSALSVLLGLQRACQAKGKALQFVRAPKSLQELARVYGIDSLVRV